ncbi:fused DSP-PTPase phosphatase/NAD kinase-like protein [Planctomycetes bacterium TBK1r]|uniref:Beta-lactamase hydrolase-like protein n=1 Tax=Stieleria magnilauensis TaxID=2527963 RepID=A0ABX5XYM9_9BACT|nr:Beta-lactamase hydrolase-like protein [Planctomycetes bacterium TBK1r]
MQDQIKINDAITVGAQPTAEQLSGLKDSGFRSVLNLRADGEDDQPLSPHDEGEQAKQLGLEYENIPVTMKTMSPELVDRVRGQFGKLPTPIYVHCQKGKRAGAMAMMHTACEAGKSGDETLAMAEQMGFECNQPQLAEFVKSYVDNNRK